MNDENNAESSTATIDHASDIALAGGDYAAYSEIENAREANTAQPEAPPASETPDKPAASEAAPAKTVQEKPKNGEDRKAELKSEIAELLRQRAELQGKTAPVEKIAESTPAPVSPAAKPAVEVKPASAGDAPKKPSLNDFATFAEYDAANDAYIADLVTFKATQIIANNETTRAAREQQNAHAAEWDKQVTAAREEHADFAGVAFSKETPITPVMDGFILKHGPRILYVLGQNGSAEGKRIAALDPYEAVEALIDLQRALPDSKSPKVVPITTPVKKHTQAPPPATSLNGNASETGDQAVAALQEGDFAAYMARENAKELKALRAA